MAYIDREKAKEFIKQYLYASIDSGQRELDIVDGGVDICKVIDDTPTADVVEVVRCKDCDRSAEYKDYYLCGVDNRAVNADSFCSYGERKDFKE